MKLNDSVMKFILATIVFLGIHANAIGQGEGILIPVLKQSNVIQKIHLNLQKVNDAAELKVLQETLNDTRNTLNTMKAVKGELEDLYAYSKRIESATEKIKNIKGFSIADGLYFSKMFLDLDLNPVNYVPNLGEGTKEFRRDLANAIGRPKSGRTLYQEYFSVTNRFLYTFEAEGGGRNQFIANDLRTSLDLEEAKGQMMMEHYSIMQSSISQKEAEADRLRDLAENPDIKMGEADRFKLNNKANEMMLEVMALREKAMEILIELQNSSYGQKHKQVITEMKSFQMKKSIYKEIYDELDVKKQERRKTNPYSFDY